MLLGRVIGTVVHSYLEHMALHGIEATSYSVATCKALLAEQGVPFSDLETGAKRVVTALNAAVNDEKARWILATTHSATDSELPISLVLDGVLERKVIDRTFISDEGERWIIDYKTSTHSGSDTESFVDNEVVRYREQLDGYRDAIAALNPDETAPVRLGLYFPSLGVFREVV